MKILTIIGNGFDLGHWLPTSFDAFIKSNLPIFSEKYSIFRSGDGTWNMIESLYGEQLCDILSNRSWHDITEVVEQIINDYGFTEYGEVNYFNYSSSVFKDTYEEIQYRIDLLTEFEKDFHQYLLDKCGAAVLSNIKTFDSIHHILTDSTRIISFNYTKTIEIAYNISNVDHIHGCVDTSIAIGSGTLDEAKESFIDADYPTIDKFGRDKYGLQELAGYYDYDDEGNRYPNVFIEEFFNQVSASAIEQETDVFNLLDVKNKDTMSSRIQVIDTLHKEYYDKVYILGHSLGLADYSVFDAINKDAEVVCFYHTQAERVTMEKTLKSLDLRHILVPNSEIYR